MTRMSPALRASVLAVLAVGAAAVWFAASRSRPPSRTLLLTGFGSFDGYATNPAWQTAEALGGERIGDLQVVAARLDVTYADAPRQLREAILEHRPDLVLSLGVAPTPALRLERVAKNRDVSFQPDNAGVVHADTVIRDGGPERLPTRLPIEPLREALQAAGYEVVISDDAGGYLCNHVFYRVLDEVDPSRIAGFVHVPPLKDSWDAARLEQAVRLLIEVLAGKPAR